MPWSSISEPSGAGRRRLVLAVLLLAPPAIGAEDAVPPGIWRMTGYGTIFDTRDEEPGAYQVTDTTCVRLPAEVAAEYDPRRWGAPAAADDDAALTLHATDGNRYRFARLPRLPGPCEEYRATDDPRTNFEVFWRTFEERYAFFDLHGVDWRAVGAEFRPRVTAETDPSDLFEIFSEMVAPLRDGHVSIRAGDRRYGTEGYPLKDRDEDLWKLVRRKYLGGNYETRLEWLQHGRLDDRTGYLRIRSMTGFSLYDRARPGEELALVEQALDRILGDLEGVERMIVDVRFNWGGDDSLARAFANRFADRRRFAYAKRPRVGAPGSYADPVRFHVEPPADRLRFAGPVVVLINGATVSAAEIFLLCMEALPHVSFVGETSAGAFSDILPRRLPNGWQFGLSNELYTNKDGKSYEGAGLRPDVEVALTERDLERRRDAALEAAMSLSPRSVTE